METPYGQVVKDGEDRRGIGLGLREPGTCTVTTCAIDQVDPSVAIKAMETRISLRTNICENNGCTETDMLIVSALAQNESIYTDDLKISLKNFRANSGTTTIDWRRYLEEYDSGNYNYNQGLIISFSVNVLELLRLFDDTMRSIICCDKLAL